MDNTAESNTCILSQMQLQKWQEMTMQMRQSSKSIDALNEEIALPNGIILSKPLLILNSGYLWKEYSALIAEIETLSRQKTVLRVVRSQICYTYIHVPNYRCNVILV